MQLSDFDFDLPEDLIALRPVRPRRAARLLVADGEALEDSSVAMLPTHLRAGDLLVFNDTQVIPARLMGTRQRRGGEGARIEVTLAEPRPDGTWVALARPGKRLAAGDRIEFGAGFSAELIEKAGAEVVLAFSHVGDDFLGALDRAGHMPLPPYIAARRGVDVRDRKDYQTIFARRPGAVAAPTASLHFDDVVMAALDAAGIGCAHVTLHVGAGTFLPVKAERIEAHQMHAERGEVGAEAAERITATLDAGGRVIAVGTTALRVIETAAPQAGQVVPWTGETRIFIRPGYAFRATGGLMTNFHLPRSTLLMLVSALMGVERIRAIYSHAIAARYRFFSYGDTSLLFP